VKVDNQKETLVTTNLRAAQEYIKAGRPTTTYDGLLCAIADTLDYAVAGNDAYITIGLTKPKDAMLMTVVYGHSRMYAGGASLWGISKDAERLL
jgi:hypothetical protein